MVEIYFNELSLTNMDSLCYETVEKMTGAYKELVKHGITTCRINEKDRNDLFHRLEGLPNEKTIKNFYVSFPDRRMNWMR